MSIVRVVFTCVLAVSSVVSVASASQTDEAAAVFDGVSAAQMRGGTWKVVYSSAEGPEERLENSLTDPHGPLGPEDPESLRIHAILKARC